MGPSARQPEVQLLGNRMDREYVERPNEAPALAKLPSGYLSDFFYGTQPLEAPREPGHLGTIIDTNDLQDQPVFTADYPHVDFDAPQAVLAHEGLTDEVTRKRLGESAPIPGLPGPRAGRVTRHGFVTGSSIAGYVRPRMRQFGGPP